MMSVELWGHGAVLSCSSSPDKLPLWKKQNWMYCNSKSLYYVKNAPVWENTFRLYRFPQVSRGPRCTAGNNIIIIHFNPLGVTWRPCQHFVTRQNFNYFSLLHHLKCGRRSCFSIFSSVSIRAIGVTKKTLSHLLNSKQIGVSMSSE